LPKKRSKTIQKAPDHPLGPDAMAGLAQRLHPRRLHLVIKEVREERPDVRTYRLAPDPNRPESSVPFFRAGQYLSVIQNVNGTMVARPYSISSSPREALDQGYLEITIQKHDNGFLTPFIWDQWNVSRRVDATGPHGFFYYDPLRDSRQVVGLAGGMGITPFRSLARDFSYESTNVSFTLLYGVRSGRNVLFHKELTELAARSGGRFRMVVVSSEPEPAWTGPTGFLSADLIRNQEKSLEDATFFICGPPAMYRFLEIELPKLNLPRRRFRWEAAGEPQNPATIEGFPRETASRTFSFKVRLADQSLLIPARGDETVLTALERAKLAPPSACRSGECGFCRAELLSGKIWVRPEGDGRRAADKKMGGFHPCASFPLSDLDIKIPRDR
jgi:ferredoxin-NADP reductase